MNGVVYYEGSKWCKVFVNEGRRWDEVWEVSVSVFVLKRKTE